MSCNPATSSRLRLAVSLRVTGRGSCYVLRPWWPAAVLHIAERGRAPESTAECGLDEKPQRCRPYRKRRTAAKAGSDLGARRRPVTALNALAGQFDGIQRMMTTSLTRQ